MTPSRASPAFNVSNLEMAASGMQAPAKSELTPLRQPQEIKGAQAYWRFVVTHPWLITGICALVLLVGGSVHKFASGPEVVSKPVHHAPPIDPVQEAKDHRFLDSPPPKIIRDSTPTKREAVRRTTDAALEGAKTPVQPAVKPAVNSAEVVMQIALKPGAAPSAVRVKLHPEWAPIGVAQFQKLVTSHALDQAAFFRVVPGFIVQFGLPATPQPEMAALKDDPVKVSNKRGTVVFATAGPNTRTNQLFINLGDNTASLDAQGFAPIGEVVSGMETVDKINPEYGEDPEQDAITRKGNEYLDQSFPHLSKIQTASLR